MTEEQLTRLQHVAMHARNLIEKRGRVISLKRELKNAEEDLLSAERSLIKSSNLYEESKVES